MASEQEDHNIASSEGTIQENNDDRVDNEGEDYPILGSSDDPEKARNYEEYKRLEKEIHFQNDTIETIKSNIQKFLSKPSCFTASEKKQLEELQDCLKQETEKLSCLTNKAMKLQNFGSRRRYKEIVLATTYDEEQMSPMIARTCDSLQAQTSKAASKKRKSMSQSCRTSGGDTTSDLEKPCSYHNVTDRCKSDEQKLMKEVLSTVQSYNIDNNCRKKSRSGTAHTKQERLNDNLKQKVESMQKTMDKLNEEIFRRDCRLCGQKGKHQKSQSATITSCTSPKAQQFENLKDNYMYLLQEFSKKEAELKDISKR